MSNERASNRWGFRGQTGRRVVITAVVAGLAGGLSGCASDGERTSGFFRSNSNVRTIEIDAGKATATVDPNAARGSYTSEWYQEQARGVELPAKWLSEARDATAAIEARRAAAQSAMVESEADRRERMALADAGREAAFSRESAARSEAQRMNTVFGAKMTEFSAQADARAMLAESADMRNAAELNASIREWEAEANKLRADSEQGWNRALAEHARMLAERSAVEERGRANIEEMTRRVDLTEQRAGAKVSSLRQQSQSITERTTALVSELNQQVETVSEQTTAEVSDLRQRARSLRDSTSAQSKGLLSEASSLDTIDVDRRYELELIGTEANYAESLAKAEEIRRQLEADEDSLLAGVQRREADHTESFDRVRSDFDSAIASVESSFEQGLSDIDVMRSEADRLERQARAQFVNAEAEARARALREESAHQRALAEADYERLRAGAESEAAKISAETARQVAQQVRSGSWSLPGNTNPVASGVSPNSDTPQMAEPSTRPNVVEPDRVAQFRTKLAEVVKLRMQADAQEKALYADADQRRADFRAWYEEKVAAHDAWSSEIESTRRKGFASIAERHARIDATLAQADAARNRALVDAESTRKETLARITKLRAEAEQLERTGEARVEQLLARADATERNGVTRVENLQVQRESTLRRGNAESARLAAEADALEQSQRAVVAQMIREIESSERMLVAELARLDRAAQSFYEIAEATYNEGLFAAETFDRIAQANASELAATHETQRRIAQAEVGYMRELASAQRLTAEAAVDRKLADAERQVSDHLAQDTMTRAEIAARAQMAQAEVNNQFTIAGAEEHAVRARFDARIAMTESDRNRAYARLYLERQQQQRRVEQAMAAAAAYEELSREALARLNERSDRFNRTADQNWDSRLALPANFPMPTPVEKLDSDGANIFNQRGFVNVPEPQQ